MRYEVSGKIENRIPKKIKGLKRLASDRHFSAYLSPALHPCHLRLAQHFDRQNFTQFRNLGEMVPQVQNVIAPPLIDTQRPEQEVTAHPLHAEAVPAFIHGGVERFDRCLQSLDELAYSGGWQVFLRGRLSRCS